LLYISDTYYFVTLFFIPGLQLSIENKIPKIASGTFLKKSLIDNIKIAYSSVEEMNPTNFYAKATLLDPRYKTAAFMDNCNADTAQQEVQYEVEELLRNRSK